MLSLRQISYIHPNKDILFEGVDLSLGARDKVALIGQNGSGKSTLLKIIAGELKASSGSVQVQSSPYFIPQIYGQYDEYTVAEALQIDKKVKALKEILEGKVSEENLECLNDDWTIESRFREALDHWALHNVGLEDRLSQLSGGQKVKVFLAGIQIHEPELILMDEPSNHLDGSARKILYEYIRHSSKTIVLVSHDRTLLNLLHTVCELGKEGLKTYGGNYAFYAEQREIERNALNQDIQSKEKTLRKAKVKERESAERQQKLDSRGKKKQEKAGVARIMMNTLQNKAENSSARMKTVHSEKVGHIAEELRDLRANQSSIDKMKLALGNSQLHQGKKIFEAKGLNLILNGRKLWQENLDLFIESGERIAIKGANGTGKTSLFRVLLGKIAPSFGHIYRAESKSVFIDQDYSLIDNTVSVYTQAQRFNDSALLEHEVKIRLDNFLFSKNDWAKPCAALSGGERMRLLLCGLSISQSPPDIVMFDEPTNNLDIQNIEILSAAINAYKGTLMVVSHDEAFLEEIGIEREIELT
ncbi:ATP-binding cassette domain-containing protein [Marinilongibacter aquaticus]|uniref:ABC-F family ATP-binding cassette domain-containing protein n=1 Tax=Marinilongibacter aquaticus TaxID=2975157 RepID=UPI0021BD9043|nr:ATP-binding cassette domain-containing protein [Marinilongibacter aquaticus]UBM59395.1 ATP-binding cassette domain-containing protein [Marinilongibacter aquaticus]